MIRSRRLNPAFGCGRRCLENGQAIEKALGLRAQRLHQLRILGSAVIVVAGHIANVAVFDIAGRRQEAIPDGLAFAVFFPRLRSDMKRSQALELMQTLELPLDRAETQLRAGCFWRA